MASSDEFKNGGLAGLTPLESIFVSLALGKNQLLFCLQITIADHTQMISIKASTPLMAENKRSADSP